MSFNSGSGFSGGGGSGGGGPAPIYGTEFQKAESLIVSVSTSSTFATKVLLNTASIPAGTYKISWSYGWSYNAGTTDFEARVVLDGVQATVDDYLMLHAQEPQDTAGTGLGRYSTTGTDQAQRAAGFYYKTFGVAAAHAIKLDWRTTTLGLGSEASIWDAFIEIVRVS